MIKKIAIALSFLFVNYYQSLSQNNYNSSEIIPTDIFSKDSAVNVFVVGESHIDDNLDVNLAILFELNRTHGVNKLGIETFIGLQEFYNRFLFNGDTTIFKLLEKDDRVHKKETIKMLTEIRNYNLNYSNGNPIRIFCFDYANNSNYSQLLILKELFQTSDNIQELKLGTYLKAENYTQDLYDLIKIVNELDVDLKSNDSLYKAILKENYNLYTQIIWGLKIRYTPIFSYEYDQFVERERYILQNVEKEIKPTDRALIICGYAHASKKLNDTLFFSEGFDSFTSMLIETTSLSTYSICQHYYLTRGADLLFNSMNLLNRPINEIVQKSTKCTFIEAPKIQTHITAAERFDMILILNQRMRFKL